jgi:iron complex transport system permease protein
MEKTRKIRCFTTFIILIILIIILLIMNVCIGTVHISFKAAFATLYDHSDRVGRIVWDIRMPRAIAAMILGGALALAGYLLQTFFHNPIAGPFVLGISSGAKMIVALVMVFLLGNAIRVSSLAMIAAAFLGAMLSMGFVLIISRKVSSMSMLVVSGVMIGYICSAVTEFVVTFADDSDIVNLHNWSRGSFSGMTWDSVGVMSMVVGITFIFVFLMSKPLMAYQLGESYAVNLGVNIKRIRVLLVLLSSLLSACIVAFAGPISFVGIAVPSSCAKTPPLSISPTSSTGASTICASPMFTISFSFRLISAGLPAPSITMISAYSSSFLNAFFISGMRVFLYAKYSLAGMFLSTLPFTITCEPVLFVGFKRIGFMQTIGLMPAASACITWARPISSPSSVI